jgi:hypothetical protein
MRKPPVFLISAMLIVACGFFVQDAQGVVAVASGVNCWSSPEIKYFVAVYSNWLNSTDPLSTR